ncbi:hypothetical protein D9757_015372 [Collybiopsis confluens]|uniref:Integrase catalytic domain-containing protein n=1 Tax=Collybiopsis confluens TaxID=2823264 RepID=A0A8H5C892_9AGAR|nr:hypothetical protein D9757_015372 [Collybiopsis confluens]
MTPSTYHLVPHLDLFVVGTRSAGLNGYLDGTISAPIPVATAPNVAPVVTPVNSRTPTPEEWELRDACLAGIVFQNIKDPRSIGVTQDMTSNVMWIALTDEYKNSLAAAQTLATERIQQCKYTTGTAFEDYFKSLEALRKSANDVGCNISNDDLRSRFLTSLPRDYLWILQNHSAPASVAAVSITATPVTAAAAVYDFSDTEPEGMGKSLHHHSPPDVLAYRLEPEATALVNMSENGVCSVPPYVPSVSSHNTNGTPTFIDSGASHWCIRNHNRFVSYRQASPTHTGRLATDGANGSFRLEGYGIAEIIVKTTEGSVNRLRFPASHTPTFGMNLLSLPAMDRKGFRGVWGNGKIEVQDPASMKVIVDGMLAGRRGGHGLYQVQVIDSLDDSLTSASNPPRSESYQTVDASYAFAASGRSRSKPCSLKMWHTCFGHADINLIRLMAKRKIVEGLEVSEFALCGKCEVCLLAKAKRKPFDDIVVPSSEPLDRISLDLWGPARTKSLGGAYYMLLACDDGTGIPFPYFLANKEAPTVLHNIENFVTMAEQQTGRKLRVIRIDMGCEFDNKLMDGWCAARGILIEKIPKALSAANGQVERANGTIIEGVRAMIEDSELDHRFWAEAASAYHYIRGMLPNARHPGVVPWEKWFEAKRARVNVSHLRRWGCRAWVTDLDRTNGKLGRQAWEGRLVGYIGRRGYRIWDPVRKGVYLVRDVEFEEGTVKRTLSAENAGFDVDVEPATPARIELIPAERPDGADVNPPSSILTPAVAAPQPALPAAIAPLRRSERIRVASRRQLESEEYLENEGMDKAEEANRIERFSGAVGGALATNREHDLSKHIDTKYLFTRDIVEKKRVAIFPVSSLQNLADIMTKSLPKNKHQRIVSALGLDWKSQDVRGSVRSGVTDNDRIPQNIVYVLRLCTYVGTRPG